MACSFFLVNWSLGQSACPGGVSGSSWPFGTFPPGLIHAVSGAADAVDIIKEGANTTANAAAIVTKIIVVFVIMSLFIEKQIIKGYLEILNYLVQKMRPCSFITKNGKR